MRQAINPVVLSLPIGICAMGVGVVVIVVGAAGRLGMRRNGFAGIRTSASMRSDQAFSAANRAGAAPLIAGGVLCLLAGLLAVLVGGPAGLAIGFGGILLLIGCTLAGAMVGNRAARHAP